MTKLLDRLKADSVLFLVSWLVDQITNWKGRCNVGCVIPSNVSVLEQEWLLEAAQWGASQQECLAVFKQLVEAYEAENRHYHGLTHIQSMLDLSGQVSKSIQYPNAFYFAIWFHDAVQIQGKDSELLSMNLAKVALTQLGAPSGLIQQVSGLILATKHHTTKDKGDMALFLDVDLSILAAKPYEYKSYANNCRKEYVIPGFVYNLGRRKFLTSLLERNFIFNSPIFQETKEHLAKANIEWELKGFS